MKKFDELIEEMKKEIEKEIDEMFDKAINELKQLTKSTIEKTTQEIISKGKMWFTEFVVTDREKRLRYHEVEW
ncbi:hypothetical protein DRJ17_04120 [Candidatus Woesearchaeota archaeon]|nr:MAG: hypothetical protein DRJ17_04120 [Candidatus Woesearchaeota archaeon]